MGTQNKNSIGSTKSKIKKSATSTEPEICAIEILNNSDKKVSLKITCEGYNCDDVLMFSIYEIITVYPDFGRCETPFYLPLPFCGNINIRYFNFTFSIINIDTGEERIISNMGEPFLDIETRNDVFLDFLQIIKKEEIIQNDSTEEIIRVPKSVYTVIME